MERESGLDLLRTFAILFVVGVHFFLHTDFYKVPVSDINMMLQVSLRWLFTMCVPLFILLTGYFQTEKKPEMKYFKKLIPILGIYLFYSVLSVLMRALYLKEDKSIIKWIADIFVFDADKYSWYINMYIGLFLIIPFLNLIHKNINNIKNYRIFLLILVSITGLPELFQYLSFHYSPLKVLTLSNWWIGIYPVTYYFLGAYIREYRPKLNKKLAALCLITVVLLETFITVFFCRNKVFSAVIGGYGSLLIMIEALMFFIIVYDIKLNNRRLKRLSATISVLSLDIFLCSYISDKLIYTYVMKNIFKSQQQIMYYYIFIVMTSFISAFVISYLRYKSIRLKTVKNNKIMKSLSQ